MAPDQAAPTQPYGIPTPPHPVAALRGYTRWTATGHGDWLRADILAARLVIEASPTRGLITCNDDPLTPDEARLYGVRLIEAAALAQTRTTVR